MSMFYNPNLIQTSITEKTYELTWLKNAFDKTPVGYLSDIKIWLKH